MQIVLKNWIENDIIMVKHQIFCMLWRYHIQYVIVDEIITQIKFPHLQLVY